MERAFEQIKTTLTSADILACYDPKRPTVIAADASVNGLGAVLLQVQDDGKRSPISYASRSLSNAKKRYAFIEKEALASVWACEKFSDYVIGMNFVLETDHKPVETLFKKTELSKTPSRIQRFHLRLMRFSVTVRYVPGKHQLTADALSHALAEKPRQMDQQFVEELETFAAQTVPTHSQQQRSDCQRYEKLNLMMKNAGKSGPIALRVGQDICHTNLYCVPTGRTGPI